MFYFFSGQFLHSRGLFLILQNAFYFSLMLFFISENAFYFFLGLFFCRLRIFSQSTIRRPGSAGGRPCVCKCVGVCVCVDKFVFKFSRPFLVRLTSNFFWDLPRVSILGNEEMAPIRRPEGCPPAAPPKTLKMP